ncbi:MAG: polysaccharide pyruvyl transferase family protein [Planctomycetota bacterium]|nr:polysaccharide pyruvyl transferase family protein [Planctomycetota bacterium]MDA1212412.1 polysaccharide pyruvyl transferase family protein [Planctomycetota bacterium]
MSKAVLVNDTFSWYHWGCNATSQALRIRIKQFGYELMSIPIQVVHQLHRLPQTLGDFDSIEFFRDHYRQYPAVINALSEADVVVVNGEGTLHRISQASLSLLYLAYASKKFLNKPVHIVNHSVYPEVTTTPRDSVAFDIYKGVYRALDYVAIREPISFRLMQQLGLPVVRSFDSLPLIVQNFYQPNRTALTKPQIVIAGSVSFPDERIPDLAHVMEQVTKRGYDVNVLIGAKSDLAGDDLRFVERLWAHTIDRVDWTLIEAQSLQEWFDTFHRASLLISGRFHHTIAASCLGVPVVMCESNTLKNQALAEMLSIASPIDYDVPEFRNVLSDRVDRSLSESRRDMTGRLEEWCHLAEKNFDGLRRLAEAETLGTNLARPVSTSS